MNPLKKNNNTINKNIRYKKAPIFKNVKKVMYSKAHKFMEEIGKNILDGERIVSVIPGSFIFGDIFEAFAVSQNVYIEEMTISTLSLNRENIDSLNNLLVGKYLGKLNLIVSDYFFSHNRHHVEYIYEKLDINNSFQLAVAGTHTKIALLKIDNKKIVFSGSANLRSSGSVETFEVETNEVVYNFHYGWHKEILDKYYTINKSIRGNELWQLVTEQGKQED